MELPPHAFVYLLPAAFIAGIVDAIAGGGGLITLPALLAAGLPPHAAVGTNKGQAVLGSLTALLRYARAGLVDRARAGVAFPAGVVGALLGAQLVLLVPPSVLRPLVLSLLVAVAVVLALRPASVSASRFEAPRRPVLVAAAIALGIGAYDGFFGPGTGTFLILAFVFAFGDDLRHASANAKVVNFASNLASVAWFAGHGVVLWQIALPMAVTQFAGAWLGSQLVMQRGERFVRVVLLVVVVALVIKLAHDLAQ